MTTIRDSSKPGSEGLTKLQRDLLRLERKKERYAQEQLSGLDSLYDNNEQYRNAIKLTGRS